MMTCTVPLTAGGSLYENVYAPGPLLVMFPVTRTQPPVDPQTRRSTSVWFKITGLPFGYAMVIAPLRVGLQRVLLKSAGGVVVAEFVEVSVTVVV